MPEPGPNEIRTPQPQPRETSCRARRNLERLVQICLNAAGEDTRLGDLAEQHVRTYERARRSLGDTFSADMLSGLAADLRYVCTAANVILFARTVDPGMRLAEPPSLKDSINLDLGERTMALLHAAARKLVLPALLLVGSAFLINGAVNVWTTWRETEALMISLQREKAEAAATQIHQYITAMQDQIAWTGASAPIEQRRTDYLRLLRQFPAIVELAQLNTEGKEVLKVSRLVRDTVDSGADFSGDQRFAEALKHNRFVGPIHFDERSTPYLSFAIAHVGASAGVTLAEVNIKRLWDIVDAIKVGETGYAFVVDGRGRLIAGRDKELIARQSDFSGLAQVAAASSGARAGGQLFATSPSGAPVLSVSAAVPELGWNVFVELPAAEARAPLWTALMRAACLLALGLLTILLASFAVARRDVAAAPAQT